MWAHGREAFDAPLRHLSAGGRRQAACRRPRRPPLLVATVGDRPAGHRRNGRVAGGRVSLNPSTAPPRCAPSSAAAAVARPPLLAASVHPPRSLWRRAWAAGGGFPPDGNGTGGGAAALRGWRRSRKRRWRHHDGGGCPAKSGGTDALGWRRSSAPARDLLCCCLSCVFLCAVLVLRDLLGWHAPRRFVAFRSFSESGAENCVCDACECGHRTTQTYGHTPAHPSATAPPTDPPLPNTLGPCSTTPHTIIVQSCTGSLPPTRPA